MGAWGALCCKVQVATRIRVCLHTWTASCLKHAEEYLQDPNTANMGKGRQTTAPREVVGNGQQRSHAVHPCFYCTQHSHSIRDVPHTKQKHRSGKQSKAHTDEAFRDELNTATTQALIKLKFDLEMTTKVKVHTCFIPCLLAPPRFSASLIARLRCTAAQWLLRRYQRCGMKKAYLRR